MALALVPLKGVSKQDWLLHNDTKAKHTVLLTKEHGRYIWE